MTSVDHRFECRRLKAENAALRGQLAAVGIEPVTVPAWGAGLTRQEAQFVGVLLSAHPKAVDRYDIEAALTPLDHVKERHIGLVTVIARKVRIKLGADAVQTIRSVGYRLGDATAARMMP